MADKPTDFHKVERAIRLLQRAGYDVFRRTAGVELMTVDRVPTEALLHYRKDGDRFDESLRRKSLSLMAGTDIMREATTFLTVPAPAENNGFTPYTEFQARFEFYPKARKEWRRP